eukprot:4763093-Alexandrium_andersonii.AAC.2
MSESACGGGANPLPLPRLWRVPEGLGEWGALCASPRAMTPRPSPVSASDAPEALRGAQEGAQNCERRSGDASGETPRVSPGQATREQGKTAAPSQAQA